MSRGVNESELSKVLEVQAYSFNFFFFQTQVKLELITK